MVCRRSRLAKDAEEPPENILSVDVGFCLHCVVRRLPREDRIRKTRDITSANRRIKYIINRINKILPFLNYFNGTYLGLFIDIYSENAPFGE